MTKFAYYGMDKTGAPIEGQMDANSYEEVVRAGRLEGHTFYSVRMVDRPGLFSGQGSPLRLEDLNLFTDQLASLTSSGVPLAPALGELARELQGRRIGAVLNRLHADIEGGDSLEEALARHGDVIPPLYGSLVRVGERTGNLPEVLRQLSEFGQRYLWFRYRLQVAMAYPAVLLFVLLLFLAVFVPNVIGEFEVIFLQFGYEMPFLSALVLGAGRGLIHVGIPVAAVCFLLLLVLPLLFRGSRSRRFLDRVKISIPLFGPIYQTVVSARFYRALSLMLSHGIPILESLHLAGLATGSALFTEAARQAADEVAGGEAVGDSLKSTGVFRKTHVWIMQQGERNGKFPEALARLADGCDQEADRLEQASLTQIGPGIVVFCGVFVGLFVVASFLPIFKFIGLIGS